MTVRVLLVDDALDVRRLLRAALRLRGGFEVVGEASGGGEGVHLAGALRPDVVVLDLGLPDLAGREVLIRIREQSPGSKVVVFSGGASEDRAWIARHVDGYVLKGVDLDHLIDLIESLGRRGGTEAVIDLPRALTSSSAARRFVEQTMTRWGLLALIDDAVLVTSELATNAVTHAGSSCRVRLTLHDAAVRIDVTDSGSGTPEPRTRSETEEHGRGLHLVAAISAAWGMEVVPGEGKVVWAELARPR